MEPSYYSDSQNRIPIDNYNDEPINELKDENEQIKKDVKGVKKNPFGQTLEESICESLKRDLYQIALRTRYVMIPFAGEDSNKHLKNWDLWGPLLLCIMLAQ